MDTKTLPLAPGSVVGLRYRVDDVLNVSASAAVVEALDRPTGARVAIKCLLPQHARDVVLMRRLQREAYVGASLCSEHVARILDCGMLDPIYGAVPGTTSESWARARGLPYVVMECLTGIDLGCLLRHAGRLDPRAGAEYGAQACRALIEVHALGIVHRDIKPANLFLTRTDAAPIIKILDFGIAKLIKPHAPGDAFPLTS